MGDSISRALVLFFDLSCHRGSTVKCVKCIETLQYKTRLALPNIMTLRVLHESLHSRMETHQNFKLGGNVTSQSHAWTPFLAGKSNVKVTRAS